MAKTLTAKSYVFQDIGPVLDGSGNIVEYIVVFNVLYTDALSTEVHVLDTVDLWPLASPGNKDKAQAIQNLIKTWADNNIL